MKRVIAVIVIILVLGLLTWSYAENDYFLLGTDSQEPFEIASKKFTSRNIRAGRQGIFEGDVKVKRGDVTLTCDKLVMVFHDKKKGNGFQSISASGNVLIVRNGKVVHTGETYGFSLSDQ